MEDKVEMKAIIDPNIIDLNMKVSDKADALRNMAKMLLTSGYIRDTEEFLKDVYEREKLGVTGIGQGIAIPHGQSSACLKSGIAIARLENPIQWESLDDGDVDMIFLFCVSAETDGDFARTHLLMLSRVAAKIADDSVLMNLKTCNSASEVCKIFSGE